MNRAAVVRAAALFAETRDSPCESQRFESSLPLHSLDTTIHALARCADGVVLAHIATGCYH